MRSSLQGLLLVDKPSGMTSFGVVGRVRAVCGLRKVGHTGTLDPFATGVLPVCLGAATRLAGLLTAQDKTYEATLLLGVRTDTLDLDGRVVSRNPVAADLNEAAVLEVFSRFTGAIDQTPPMYSALKVGGKRLHAYAREGVTVPRKPRRVVVHSLELLSLSLPRVTFRVRCSKGTYIRVLASDIGDALGCGAHLVALRRTQTGSFDVADALPLDTLVRLAEKGELARRVISPRDMLSHLRLVELSEAEAVRVSHGNEVTRFLEAEGLSVGERVRICLGSKLLAVGEVTRVESRERGTTVSIQPRTVLAKN